MNTIKIQLLKKLQESKIEPNKKRELFERIKNLKLTEGIVDAVKCKLAKKGVALNQEVLGPDKEGLKNCERLKENKQRYEDCKAHFTARIRMTEKAIAKGMEKVKKYCK